MNPRSRNKKPRTPTERKLRRKIAEMTTQVRLFLAALDRVMECPSTPERGKQIADLCNQLNMYNDGVRYFWCGVNYRTDKPLAVRSHEKEHP